MKAIELLESRSLEGTLAAIISDMGFPVTETFEEILKAASSFTGNGNNLRAFPFIRGGVESRMWWTRIWNPRSGGLQNELFDLAIQSGPAGAELNEYLRRITANRGSFLAMSVELPPILIRIGKALGSRGLVDRAIAWMEEKTRFDQAMDELEQSSANTATGKRPRVAALSPSMDPIPVKPKKPSLVPQQNATAEKAVNDLLNALPAGVRGDLRNAISKSSNKLMALMSEISKRPDLMAMLSNLSVD